MKRPCAVAIGVVEHSDWAIFVTAASDGALLDRRKIGLLDPGLPAFPHHHEGQSLPLSEAVRLVERVRASADEHAERAFDAIASAVSVPIAAIALRACPPLPPTVAERITDYRAQNVADSVLFREALAGAATRKSWRVRWYDKRTVFAEAAAALCLPDLAPFLKSAGDAAGRPWQTDHKLALAAAVAAAAGPGRRA